MIIFMAGASGGIQTMPHAHLYRHVLFSHFVYLKNDFKWVKKRKLAEQKAAKKRKKTK